MQPALPKLLKVTVFSSIAIVLVSIMMGAAEAAEAGETISVMLHSGRKFTAQVDSRTNLQKLWLRFGQDGTLLLRPIAWENVAFAMHNGHKIDANELRSKVLVLASTKPTVANIPVEPLLTNRSFKTFTNRAAEAFRDEDE